MDPTVLLVEDEPAIRDSVKRVLRNDGLNFLEASNGEEALNIVASHSTDLILLDLQMPRMDGFTFLERFRSSNATWQTPVCVMTGGSAADDRRRAIDLGADDFIRKPTEAVELRTRIKSLLRIGRYQRELSELNGQLELKVEERTIELSASVKRLEDAQRATDLAYRETVMRLSLAAEMKDDCTAAHLERMSHYSALLAEKCGWRAEDVALLTEAAKMHDIGKLGVPDEILNKPGKLTKREFAVIQQHTLTGTRILAGSRARLLQMAAVVALTHHERFDGSGYPQALRGRGIPEVGRIVAIADVFDALMTRRTYKPAWSLEKTVATMSDESGKHFDPDLLALFLDDTRALVEIHDRFDEDSAPKDSPSVLDSISLSFSFPFPE
jgi:putative two-component system response regulator